MNLLHTSDWHLGRALYGRKRYEEFAAFLDWLADTIERERIDVLLVAGDVFDTSAPSNRAQGLYYRFLCRVAASPCRHVVVVAQPGGGPDAGAVASGAVDVDVVDAARLVGGPGPAVLPCEWWEDRCPPAGAQVRAADGRLTDLGAERVARMVAAAVRSS